MLGIQTREGRSSRTGPRRWWRPSKPGASRSRRLISAT